ncbi:MAG: glycosyltransferase family 4 protein, partial [Pseudomonadales bacterium]|nr:glycosyltransferase family 4 protein [Pseudomonadales bacterium]
KKQAYLQEIEQLISNENLSQHITMTGHRSDIKEVFSQSDLIYSLSSQAETFGRTVLEALYLGKSVLGWNHGGVGEILAACYPQGSLNLNDTVSLLSKTKDLLHSPQTPPIINQFRLEDMCGQTLKVYEDLVSTVTC